MGRTEKLIKKAINSPQNIRFEELCKLCELFGMKQRSPSSSHVMYTHSLRDRPLSIQSVNGKAKPYQVKQLLSWAEEMGFLKEYIEEGGEQNV